MKHIEDWQDIILGYDEECLTPHMKILILRWDRIEEAATHHNKIDKHGYVWLPVPYIAKVCGCHKDTMIRTLAQMGAARYIDKDYKNRHTPQQTMGIKMMQCVYDAHFEPLPNTRKGNGQKKFFCLDCGSRNVEVKPKIYLVQCKSCGSEHYQTNKGKRAEQPRKEVYLSETS